MNVKLITLFSILIGLTCQAQMNTAYYGEDYIKMIIDTAVIKNARVKSIILSQQNALKKAISDDEIFYELIFSKNKSHFRAIEFLESDFNPNLSRALVNGTFYNDLNKKIAVHEIEAFGTTHNVKKKNTVWRITNEQKQIKGFNCYKAVGTQNLSNKKHNIIAWFTRDIPFNFGPKGYYGLPGLIVELEDKGRRIYIKELKLKDKKAINAINLPDSDSYITEEEFNNIAKNALSKI